MEVTALDPTSPTAIVQASFEEGWYAGQQTIVDLEVGAIRCGTNIEADHSVRVYLPVAFGAYPVITALGYIPDYSVE